jgi:hypothetical protein
MHIFKKSKHGAHLKAVAALVISSVLFPVVAPADTGAPGIQVELKHAKSLSLRVTLRSGTATTVKFTRDKLPWATSDSMVIIAAVAGGSCLEKEQPIEDPVLVELFLNPNEAMSGDIDLERMFPRLKDVLKLTDVQLFWAYEAPEALHFPHWSGGWLLIPKQK